MWIEAVNHVVIHFVVGPSAAVDAQRTIGPVAALETERVDAEEIVVNVVVFDIAVDVDLVVEVEVCPWGADDFPTKSISFRAIIAQIADVAVDDIHPRFQRSHAVSGQSGPGADIRALVSCIFGIRTIDRTVPGRHLGGTDVDVSIIRANKDDGIAAGHIVALHAQLIDVAAKGRSVQDQGRSVLKHDIGVQFPNSVSRIDQCQRRSWADSALIVESVKLRPLLR